jgi:hypothetical protein
MITAGQTQSLLGYDHCWGYDHFGDMITAERHDHCWDMITVGYDHCWDMITVGI